MRALLARGEARVRAAQRRQVERIADEWRERLPGARVSAGAGEVIVEARGLARRWLGDPLLRFAGRVR